MALDQYAREDLRDHVLKILLEGNNEKISTIMCFGSCYSN